MSEETRLKWIFDLAAYIHEFEIEIIEIDDKTEFIDRLSRSIE